MVGDAARSLARIRREPFVRSRLCWGAVLHAAVVLLLLGIPLQAVAQETATPPPAGFRTSDQGSAFAGDLSTVYAGLDAFWAETFRTNTHQYVSPGLASTAGSIPYDCSQQRQAFYCPVNSTMYLDPYFVQDILLEFGDFAPIVVLSHEWGHHLQALTNVPYLDSSAELQADCLAGVYAREAEGNGLLDSGDITEAVTISGEFGDSPLRPQDIPGAHGTDDQRITSFMTGYITGLVGCALPGFASTTAPPPANEPHVPLPPVTSQPSLDLPDTGLASLLPGTLPLSHSQCFRIEDTLQLGFEDIVARLEGTDEARTLLNAWGWKASANRTFGCDTPPDGEAGYVDISLHQFGSPQAAQEAVDYFATLRARGTSLISADPPAMGDHAAVLTGPASNGKEFTLYVSRGPLLVRVTAISPTGVPFGNVLTITSAILASLPSLIQAPLPLSPLPQPTVVIAPQGTVPVTNPAPDVNTSAGLLPTDLPVANGDCFKAQHVFVYTFPTLVERFPGVPDAAAKLQALGWLEGASREYTCADPLPGQLNWAYISVHSFPDASLASAAAVFFASSRALATQLQPDTSAALGDSSLAIAGLSETGEEYSLFVTKGPYLLRVTGVASEGDSRPEVERIMLSLLADMMIEIPPTPMDVAGPLPLPTPTLSPVSTAALVPTAAATPTTTPAPTVTPLSTAVSLPAATLAPSQSPTSTPVPTLPPTETAIPDPTPTPGAIVVETPMAVEPSPTPAPIVAVPTPNPTAAAGVEAEHRDWVIEELLAYREKLDERYQSDDPQNVDYRDVQVEAAYIHAIVGIIGTPTGADIYSGANDADEALQEAAEAVAIFDQPGTQFVDVAGIYRQTFARLLATDMSDLTPQQQVAITNAALFTVEISMPSDSLRAFMVQFDQKGADYIRAVATDDTNLTYPEYLNELGMANFLG